MAILMPSGSGTSSPETEDKTLSTPATNFQVAQLQDSMRGIQEVVKSLKNEVEALRYEVESYLILNPIED